MKLRRCEKSLERFLVPAHCTPHVGELEMDRDVLFGVARRLMRELLRQNVCRFFGPPRIAERSCHPEHEVRSMCAVLSGLGEDLSGRPGIAGKNVGSDG